jgi:VIT1/CCC1 family predicted Fe2+/Mn2+ transporter
MIAEYRGLLDEVRDARIRAAIQRILEHENLHESRLIGEVREQKIDFLSSMVLGLNDGLIELTGALVGFAFAFRRTAVVALAGAITGIAATLSMSASAFMQARHETGKDPIRAAAYTGGAYLAVVALLILPFALIGSLYAAIGVMAAVVLAVIAGASFYSAVVLERPFAAQLTQMALFSVGVAGVAFVLGLLLRSVAGVNP